MVALLRSGRPLPADRPAVLLAVGAVLLAALEIATASALDRWSSHLLVLGPGLGLLLVGAGLPRWRGAGSPGRGTPAHWLDAPGWLHRW